MGPSRLSNQPRSSAATRCKVPRISHVRTIERSWLRACLTVPAFRPALRTRSPRPAALISWACRPQISRSTTGGVALRPVAALSRCAWTRSRRTNSSEGGRLAAGGARLHTRLGHPRGIQQTVELLGREPGALSGHLANRLAGGQRLLGDACRAAVPALGDQGLGQLPARSIQLGPRL